MTPYPKGGFDTDEEHAKWLEERIVLRATHMMEAAGIRVNIDPSNLGEFLLLSLQAAGERATRELQEVFDARHAADMRAIARWQAEKPDRELRQPDHADLVEWLLGRLEEAEEALRIAEWCGSPPPIRTKHKTSEELIVMPDPSFMPQDGAVFRHYKGGLYQVLMVVRREGSQEDMVVYQDRDRTMPWVRPLSEFAEKFSYVSNVGWEPS